MAEASLLIPVIKGTLELSISLAKDPIMDQIKPVWGFKQDLKKLCKRLEIIQGLLKAAENQNVTSEPMLAWLKHLKAATCDAENVLDELAYEDLRRKIEAKCHLEEDEGASLSSGTTFFCHTGRYVVDAAGRDSVPISRSELHNLLTKPSLSGITLLVLGNKIKKSEAISTQALMDQL
ncbi:hypothetical protein Vadar_023860 [Vaccinium darrowii]|uniref:Uncharacterized protein n=1 Tax=Vaccinium darrowii TaxID=229202 RepID=A0ACB7Z652_9ERIC|nr:hypothetical protein Vadar_023860 [Vaccinium darrowii]